ncbi:MAG: serine protease [Lacunisphaera sp.]
MKFSPSFFAAALLALAIAPTDALALTEAEAAAGRALVKRYADTIVGVEMVVTLKGTQGDRPLPPREQKREINGTMVAANGLTVLSLASIDPRGSIPPAMMAQIHFDEPEFKEVKLRLADGTEIPARVVLKDADLDLAFIAPLPESAPAGPLPFVDLANHAEAIVLGTYYDISRASKLQQRVPAVRVIYVSGMIEKPRRFVLASEYSPGCPSFAADGKVLGIALRHVAGGQSTSVIILPAEDVAEVAKEAAAIKPEPAAEAAKTP